VTPRHSETEGTGPEEPVVVRDRRRVDPQTGEVRPPAADAVIDAEVVDGAESAEAPASAPAAGAPASDVEKQLSERTADLQRLQAEYANYRKRVDRDREAVVQGAKASVVGDLLPLLDDLQRAEQHGDLTGAFKAMADKLVSSLQRAGLESFGAEGEEFDPSVHEAVQHATSPDVKGPTVTLVMRRGYRFGERVLRAALVGVTDHEPGAAPAEPPVDGSVGGELPLDGSVDEPGQQ